MENFGTLTVYAYTSDARLPVEGARVEIRKSLEDGELIAEGVTDRSGYLPPVRIPSPSRADRQTPDQATPFATVAVTITHPDYETEKISGVQVFPNTVTVQSFRMIPKNTAYPGQEQDFETPAQNL